MLQKCLTTTKPTKEEILKLKKKLGLIRTTIYENPSSIWDFDGLTSLKFYSERNPDNFQDKSVQEFYIYLKLRNKIEEKYGYSNGQYNGKAFWEKSIYDDDVNEYRKTVIRALEKANNTTSSKYQAYTDALKRVEENRAKKTIKTSN